MKPVLLIFGFVCLIYSQTLDSPWVMDDYGNIRDNPKIQMHTLSLASIKASLYGTPSFENTLYRPVSNLSFALNWLWGKNNVTGYHVVNIAVHLVTALLLYLTLVQLLQTPNAGRWDQKDLYFIALFSTIFWAINPIQIQAVTYIVQRMASLAALFYMMGILCFLKARMAQFQLYRIIFAGLCVISFVLGMGSKNNAILLPVFLLLIEFIFFRDLSRKDLKKKAVVILITTALLLSVAGVLLFFDKGLSQILDPYKVKPFSMGQRLLTQPSVLLFYLSQIFYPIAHRFSITHDVTYATSLVQPWYTAFSISAVILLIGFALWRIRKNPMISFAILFFFGNHVIESTILPLEMIFEHRNYLPSFFLFVPISIGIQKILLRYRDAQKPMYYLLVGFICALMTGIGLSTYIRNWDWHSTQSLWQDAANKAPKSSRPLHNLAWGYYETVGQYEKALELYQSALGLRDDQAYYKAVLHTNMAGIHFYRNKNYEKAIDHAQKALEILPISLPAKMILYNSQVMQGKLEEVLPHLDTLIDSNPFDPIIHYLKASMLMKDFKFESALTHFRQCVKLEPDNWAYLQKFGICLTQMGHYERGYWFLNRARTLNPKGIDILLALADNCLKKNSPKEAAQYLQPLIQITGAEHIEMVLEEISKDPMGNFFDIAGLSELIAVQIKQMSDSYEKTAAQIIRMFETGQ